jgi:hypothetical protein
MRGHASKTITIKGILIVKEIDSDKRFYIEWHLKKLAQVPQLNP